MSTIVRRPLYQFTLDGDVVQLAADPVQNEALEGVITRAADFELKDQPTVDAGLPVRLDLVERVASTTIAQFKGWTNKRSGQSFPNRAIVPCVGPLSRLRRPATHDHDLTGMTDGEAWMHVADACDVAYDPDDIQDAGYVLGAIMPVYWLTDMEGQEMIAELDRVMGMATIEIGAGRPIRFAYDHAPDADLIGAHYKRGENADFWNNQRDTGDLDAISNFWKVNGLSWSVSTDDGGDGCQRTIWARASGDNDYLGPGVRNRAQEFPQSDLIQDTALAEAIAERMMRWHNRLPDTITVRALNDPNVNCGSVIGVSDSAYAIDLGDGAGLGMPYLNLTIDRRGDEMTLNCVGGAPGDTGTITSGVEKVCNATSTAGLDSPPTFTPPTIMVPPDVTTEDVDTGGGTDDLMLTLDQWAEDIAPFTTSPGHILLSVGGGDFGGGHHTSREVDPTVDWSFACTFQFTGDPGFHVGIGGSSPSNPIVGRREALIDMSANHWVAQTQGDADDEEDFSGPFDEGEDITLEITWDQGTTTFATTLTQGAHVETLSSFDPYDAGGTGPYHPFIYAFEGTGDLDFSAFTVTGG